MNKQPIEDFFREWQELPPEAGKNCPSDSDLVEWAKEKDPSKWPPHAGKCPHCGTVLRLLQRTVEPNSNFSSFLNLTAKDSQKIMADRPASFMTYLRALFSINNPGRTVAAIVVLAAVLTSLWMANKYHLFYKLNEEPALVYLPENKPAYAIRLTETQVEALRNSPAIYKGSPTEIADFNEKVKQYNDLIVEVKHMDGQRQLQPEERGRLKDLLTQYYSELYLRREELTSTKVSSSVPAPAKGPDYDQFAALYTNVDRAISKKNEPVSQKPTTETERAYAVRSASQEITIHSVNTPGEVTLWDRVQFRPPEERMLLVNGIKAWVDESNITVEFKSGSGTSRITPKTVSTFSRP